MARQYRTSNTSINVDEVEFKAEEETDVESISTPKDWKLEDIRIFGKSIKIQWSRVDGGFISIKPLPYPENHKHHISLSGREEIVDGKQSALKKAIKFIRENTADNAFRVKGPRGGISYQYSSDLTHTTSTCNNPIIDHDTIDIKCVQCDQKGLIVTEQTIHGAHDEMLEIEYEALCECGCSVTINSTETQL